MHEIPFSQISGLRVGHAQDEHALTGCTVVLAESDMAAGLDIRGGGPASRESALLSPLASCERIHAVLLSGGSAFGLRAADGVMTFLESRGQGFDTGVAHVPLVCASCLFDLGIGDPQARPDADMAFRACLDAERHRDDSGNIGAGTGCTVGKLYGPQYMMRSGLGCFAVELGKIQVGAMVAVNALGDVFDPDSGRKLAGMIDKEHHTFLDSEEELIRSCSSREKNLFTGNTTLGVVITNAAFRKPELNKIASMAHDGYARCIRPVHTSVDGDSIYALSVGEVHAHLDAIGTLAAHVMCQAIRRAVLSAVGLPHCPAARDLKNVTDPKKLFPSPEPCK